MQTEWLAIIMFAGFVLMLLTGYPVAFSFAGTAIVFGLIGLAFGVFDLNRLLPCVKFSSKGLAFRLVIFFYGELPAGI